MRALILYSYYLLLLHLGLTRLQLVGADDDQLIHLSIPSPTPYSN